VDTTARSTDVRRRDGTVRHCVVLYYNFVGIQFVMIDRNYDEFCARRDLSASNFLGRADKAHVAFAIGSTPSRRLDSTRLSPRIKRLFRSSVYPWNQSCCLGHVVFVFWKCLAQNALLAFHTFKLENAV
jgi:hypothetical protein